VIVTSRNGDGQRRRSRPIHSLRDDDEAEGTKIGVESESGDIIEERGYDYEWDRVAERKFVVAAVAAENLLGFRADAVAVIDNMEIRLDFRQDASASL
jgi:hypothetical protein